MIKNPYIVELRYAFQTPDKVYFVMEFVNGGELLYHLRREKKFAESKAGFYLAEVIIALECLHKNGIIYRDLKPENILLDQEGHAKITDFGLSKAGVEQGKGAKAYTLCGTPEYLAPEIIKGEGHNKAVDWWSSVNYRCLLKTV
jgi:serine/threonine protein kinase